MEQKYLILYTSERISLVMEHNGEATVTTPNNNVLVETKENALKMLTALGVDCTALEEYNQEYKEL